MADQKMRATQRRNPWLAMLGGAMDAVVRADVTHKKRLKMLRSLADKINAAVGPESACGDGCSACCKIQVEMSQWEAKLIGEELGLKVLEPAAMDNHQERSLELLGRACGFLKEDRCSIYAARPIACRLHHNLSYDASMCQPEVVPEESMVPTLNLMVFHVGYMACSGGGVTSDIGDFFVEAKRGDLTVSTADMGDV
jgi:Fe-S-cluster containining protein